MECKDPCFLLTLNITIYIGIYPEWNVKVLQIHLWIVPSNWNISRMECKEQVWKEGDEHTEAIGIYPEWNVKAQKR